MRRLTESDLTRKMSDNLKPPETLILFIFFKRIFNRNDDNPLSPDYVHVAIRLCGTRSIVDDLPIDAHLSITRIPLLARPD